MRGLSGCVCLSGFFSCVRRILWWRRRRWRAMRRVRMHFVFWAWDYVWSRRPDDWRLRQARDVVKSEDRAEKRVAMRGAEEFAAPSWSRAGQPGWAARVERYDGDAECRHDAGFSGAGFSLPSCDHECDFVQKRRSEALRLSNGAQARVPVPLEDDYAG